jgi:hypothetical protein
LILFESSDLSCRTRQEWVGAGPVRSVGFVAVSGRVRPPGEEMPVVSSGRFREVRPPTGHKPQMPVCSSWTRPFFPSRRMCSTSGRFFWSPERFFRVPGGFEASRTANLAFRGWSCCPAPLFALPDGNSDFPRLHLRSRTVIQASRPFILLPKASSLARRASSWRLRAPGRFKKPSPSSLSAPSLLAKPHPGVQDRHPARRPPGFSPPPSTWF